MTETAQPTDSRQATKGTWKLGPQQRRMLITAIAVGKQNMRELAQAFGLSHQYVRELAVTHREEIEELKAEEVDKERLIFHADRFNRNMERQADLLEIKEEMAMLRRSAREFTDAVESPHPVPAGDQWVKLLQAKHAIIRAIQEDYGQMPLRSPAHRLGLLPTVPGGGMLPTTLTIYPEWNPKIHWINPFEVPDSWARWWGVDFGFDHPFAWHNYAESPDGVLFLVQEILRTRTIEEEHAHEIIRLTAGQRMPQAMVCDHDPSGQATLVKHLAARTNGALNNLRVVSAYKDVDEGIAAVRMRLRGERFFIFRNSVAHPDQLLMDRHRPTCTAEEFPTYVYGPDGKPLKDDDDGLDTARYVISQIDLVGG